MTLLEILAAVVPSRRLARRLKDKAERARWRLHQANTAAFRECCAGLSRRVREPFFVKVGAHDGIKNDPCSDILLADPAWKGMLIEPVPGCFAKLQANFPDASRFTLEQVAVGPGASPATFYYVAADARESLPQLPDYFDQLGSFDRNHILKHCDGVLEPFIRKMEVEVLPLSALLQRRGVQVCHLLTIDTEGYDDKVLRTLDFTAVKPLVIFIEHDHLAPAEKRGLARLLRRHGYVVRDCGRDYFARGASRSG
ncbi:MAG: FkbM family methyltransferase [Planctomycetia bacterium]|nr:FkbM family methyltransferase [Planctomycetia bacterium]